MAKERARECAIFLRWFKAPVLSIYHRDHILSFVEAQPREVLPQWLTEQGATLEACALTVIGWSEGWAATLAELLYETNFEITSEDAAAIADVEDWRETPQLQLPDQLASAAMRLARVCPFLLNQVHRTLLAGPIRERLGQPGLMRLRDLLRSALPVSASERETLWNHAMRVDEFFLDHLVQNSCVRPPQGLFAAENYKLAASLPAFRRLVAHKLLTQP